MRDPADIRRALEILRREGRSWEAAWSIAAGSVPAPSPLPNIAPSVERFTYLAFEKAYHRDGMPCRLTPGLAEEESYGRRARGKSQGLAA